MAEFDQKYWDDHWAIADTHQNRHLPVNPYLQAETQHLSPGTALDAGCGTGTEAIWLAEHGWQVTAADISRAALSTGRAQAAHTHPDIRARIDWVNIDLSQWTHQQTWDLVITNYAHADIGQLALYRRLASWVAPGGTLLIVGHHGHDPSHPAQATATLETIADQLTVPEWRIESAYENSYTLQTGNSPIQLRDVIVRASKLS